jgi:heme A synthase
LSFSRTSAIVEPGEFHNGYLSKELSRNYELPGEEIIMTDLFATLHFYNMFLVFATSTISGLWGLVLWFRKQVMNRPWRISLIVAGAVGALQGVFGIILVLLGERPRDNLHYVYGGIVALGFIVAIAFTTGGRNKRLDVLIYSIAALAIAAAGVRALMTGQ